jgi:hypothetical protein
MDRTFCQMLLYSSGPSWVTWADGRAGSAAVLITTKPSHLEAQVSRHIAALAWFFSIVYT